MEEQAMRRYVKQISLENVTFVSPVMRRETLGKADAIAATIFFSPQCIWTVMNCKLQVGGIWVLQIKMAMNTSSRIFI